MKTILIFVKAAVSGQVKTRLIPALGARKATDLYGAMAKDTMDVGKRVVGAQVQVAYDGKNPTWLHLSSARWFPQTGKNLGERLIHAFDHAFQEYGGPVLAIGSDLPALSPRLLRQAFAALRRVPVVIGPSCDGGYYLIGLNSPQPGLFRNIAWSSSKVLAQTLSAAKRSRLACLQLARHEDIDTIQDVERLKRAIRIGGGIARHFRRTRGFLKKC